MKGIILAYNLYKNNKINKGDIVQRLDGYDNNIYTVEDINMDYYPNQFFLRSKDNDISINFSESELCRCHYAFFDYEEYFKSGNKILLGAVSNEDMLTIKSKKLIELDLGMSEIDHIKIEDIIGLDFYGDIVVKEIYHDNVKDVIKYFKIDKK